MLKHKVKQFAERAIEKLLSSQRINERLNHTKEEQSKINKPIFIVGCGRSGTTLLFQLLKQHPQLVGTHICEFCDIDRFTNVPLPVDSSTNEKHKAHLSEQKINNFLEQSYSTRVYFGYTGVTPHSTINYSNPNFNIDNKNYE